MHRLFEFNSMFTLRSAVRANEKGNSTLKQLFNLFSDVSLSCVFCIQYIVVDVSTVCFNILIDCTMDWLDWPHSKCSMENNAFIFKFWQIIHCSLSFSLCSDLNRFSNFSIDQPSEFPFQWGQINECQANLNSNHIKGKSIKKFLTTIFVAEKTLSSASL